MQGFKRFGLYLLRIALIVILVSAALILPYLRAPIDAHDQALRASLAGTIDTLILGQSYAMDSVMPERLDARLGTSSYNLSGSMMPLYGQRYMLEKEMARNPVHTILLEFTPDTFTTDERQTYGNGDTYVVGRLDNLAERLSYLLREVQPADWPNVYARILTLSMRHAAYRLLGRAEERADAARGFNAQEAEDVSMDDDWARATHQGMQIFREPLAENILEYEALLSTCIASGCEVVMIYPPVSHAKIWQLSDQDDFLAWATGLAERYGVPLLDFNLLKDRYTLFSDETSFSDDNHLSREGALVFSDTMANILARLRAGEDVSSFFYASYRDAIRNSVYWRR